MDEARLDKERGYLDKWEMYKALRGRRLGPCRLPYTERLSDEALVRMLGRFRRVYVKPVDGWGGHGVGVIARRGDRWAWTVQGEPTRWFVREADLVQVVRTAYGARRGVVQQAAPLARYRGRPFDVRVHLQRDAEDAWVYAGELARVGGAGALVSNVAVSGGEVLPADEVIRAVLGHRRMPMLLRQLRTVGLAVARELERYRLFEEMGIDLGVGRDARLWLIEVNTDDALGAPSHELFAHLPDGRVYEAIRARAEARRKAWARWFFDALDAPDARGLEE
ncbi:MAG: YheC/YheD family protein [Alicyclobacillus macrosporangiidus]|uniref:YheC/YheD family protein n=1 Tax=Alicyclobacillus macrosporangiidus TaxID=392015 RepID=UPI0026EF24F5|nr:YheC/YheD family protein [Alicyclobacillus macrosporangiidus]MCL6600660.1 YheC/YheD family protein [Alicyclobacillus macrosporangiidus]